MPNENINPELAQRLDAMLDKVNKSTLDLYDFMDMAVSEVLSLTHATGVVVELVDGNEMVYRATTGVMKEFLGLRLPKSGSISGLCVDTSDVLICNDTENDPRVNLAACRKVHARSLVVAPLFHVRNPVGVLKIISDKPDAFTDQDIHILKQVAWVLGGVLAQQIHKDISDFF